MCFSTRDVTCVLNMSMCIPDNLFDTNIQIPHYKMEIGVTQVIPCQINTAVDMTTLDFNEIL
jgi:hypothetical protein